MSTGGVGGDPGDWRDTEFGHGQERYYGGSPSPPPPNGPHDPRSTPIETVPAKRRSKGPLIAGAGVLALGLLAGGGYLVMQLTGDGEPAAQPSTSSETDPGVSKEPVAQPNPQVQTRTAEPTGPQQNRGGENDHAVFTVPERGEFTAGNGDREPIWRMHSNPKDIAGYGSLLGKDASVGYAPTFYRDGYCKTSSNAGLGLFVWEGAGGDGPLEAASSIGSDWLKSVATRDDGKMEKYDKSPEVKGVTLKDSGTKAVQFRGRTPMTEKDSTACGVDEAEVVVTALDTGRGTSAVVAVRKLGHPDSLSDEQFDKILNSIRPEGQD